MSEPGSADADAIRLAAKAGEPDRYLAALLAPNDSRDDLIAIAAFSAELQRAAEQVSDPALGEIRLRWLRDAVTGATAGERTGHPVADAAGAALRRRSIPRGLVDDLLDAHAHRLYADGPADDDALILELDMTEGVLFRIAAAMLGVARDDAIDAAITTAAKAYGLARIGLGLPMMLARGRNPLPQTWFATQHDAAPNWQSATGRLCNLSREALGDCRARLHGCPAPLTTALLPLAVVEPYLAALQRRGFEPSRDIAEIAPLTRVWRIGRARISGRI